MSNQEQYSSEEEVRDRKKRKTKLARACDVCRRKKIRCDGPQGPGEKCLNCVTFKTECTYGEVAKKRGPPKGYTQTLENRVAQLEALLRKHCPNLNLEREVGGPLNKQSYRAGKIHPAQTSPHDDATITASSSPSERPDQSRRGSRSPVLTDEIEPSDDEYLQNTLTEDPQRFLGKASGIALIQAAIDYRSKANADAVAHDFGAFRREHFWTIPKWEASMYEDEYPEFVFPDPDLMWALINLYFDYVNALSPIVHRPTFEANVHDRLHLRNPKFGALLLMVCAMGSRFSDDPRIYVEGTDGPQSAGWNYFDQVSRIRRSLVAPPCLYDLQIYPLITLFVLGSSAPHAVWSIIGIGLRMAQDVGANRRQFYGDKLTVETESWKRAFWVLVAAERHISAGLGRPCTLQDEDIDVDWPAECDDEYWTNEDPTRAFKQPPGKPTYVTFYNYTLRLANITGAALRTIYSTGRRRAFFGQIGHDWEERTVADMDSTLNRWFHDIPDHLRWMPNDGNPIFFRQSAQLHCAYYYNQILIHRPFIGASKRGTQLAMSCMAICTNAARSIVNIGDIVRRRGDCIPGTIVSTFTACVILLLHVLGGKRAGISSDLDRGMQDVHKGLAVLDYYENRWHVAGAFWDMVWDLGRLGNLPLPPPRTSNKRASDSGERVPGHACCGDPRNFGVTINSLYGSTVDAAPGFISSPGERQAPGTYEDPLSGLSSGGVAPSSHFGSHATAESMYALGPEVPTPNFPSRIARRMAEKTQTTPIASTSASSNDNPDGALHFLQGANQAMQSSQFSVGDMALALDMFDEPQMHAGESQGTLGNQAYFHSSAQGQEQTAQSQTYSQSDAFAAPLPTWTYQDTLNIDQQARHQQPQAFDTNVLAMWSTIPSTIVPDDWSAYMSSMNDLMNHPAEGSSYQPGWHENQYSQPPSR